MAAGLGGRSPSSGPRCLEVGHQAVSQAGPHFTVPALGLNQGQVTQGWRATTDQDVMGGWAACTLGSPCPGEALHPGCLLCHGLGCGMRWLRRLCGASQVGRGAGTLLVTVRRACGGLPVGAGVPSPRRTCPSHHPTGLSKLLPHPRRPGLETDGVWGRRAESRQGCEARGGGRWSPPPPPPPGAGQAEGGGHTPSCCTRKGQADAEHIPH